MGRERAELRGARVDLDDRYAACPSQVRKARCWLDDARGADNDDQVGVTAYPNGVRELALDLKVNPNTVQRALAELDRQGLTRSERTTGRFITDDESVIAHAREDLAEDAADTYARRAQGLGMSLTAARELLGRQWPTGNEGGTP